MNINLILHDADNERFAVLTYDAAPIVRALFCCELAGLSWNGLYEYLSTDGRAIRLGFDPAKFCPYNTAPIRQILTAAWETELSDDAKRAILAVSERLVDIAHENDNALDFRQPRHVEENDSDLRERQVGDFSDDQIRQTIRLARDTMFGAFDSGRAANVIYPDSRFDELQALMSLFECGTPQGQSRMANFFGNEYTPHTVIRISERSNSTRKRRFKLASTSRSRISWSSEPVPDPPAPSHGRDRYHDMALPCRERSPIRSEWNETI
ncbi:hypothetical protein [Halocatena pleomorpha]|uniref:Uncharacterized protein n=1 Tax=Halocatena pleomorpha TaxID=1785090 RepID=A0A3P3RMC1_9EURY|nr:hypothetical protein [Halocatena pleomorpha]RRJ34028.1 hypothetical protein EIK79_00515 [Halocatena pleomorpha]